MVDTGMVDGTRLRLMGRFELSQHGMAVALPIQSQRVLGYLAVVEPSQTRAVLAGRLWGEMSQERAMATLRNALWGLRKACSDDVVETSRVGVAIAPHLRTDLADVRECAANIDSGHAVTSAPESIAVLSADLLTGWEDDWLRVEREGLRQLRIHALESLADVLTRRGRYGQAIQAALAAIRAEPLRESAQVALVKAHLLEGNTSEAVRQVESYRQLLARELGLQPSDEVETLLADHLHRVDARRAARAVESPGRRWRRAVAADRIR